MLALKTLDVVIGMVFVFLLLSTVCMALREAIEAGLKTRAAYLERGIRELLHDPSGRRLVSSLFAHPLLAGLFMGTYQPKPAQEKLPLFAVGRGLPSYIPAKSFAVALLDLAGRGLVTDEVSTDPASVPLTVAAIRARLLNIDNLPVRRVLLTALDASHGDLQVAVAHVETWFNSAMDRVSGWYRRSTQWIVLAIALVVTVAMNVDTLTLVAHLYASEASREASVAAAETAVRASATADLASARTALNALQLPIGWHAAELPVGIAWVNRVLGWLITAIAATLGTPFWFDVLNKVMTVRSTVKPHAIRDEASSHDGKLRDAQPPASAPALPVPPALTPALLEVLMPRDPDNEQHDGCEHTGDETPDEELPQAEGGVA